MTQEFVFPIEWWTKDRFQGRVSYFAGFDRKDGHTYLEQTSIPIPDDEIVCDLCNRLVDEFPCAVVHGYALCVQCRSEKYHIHKGDDEYFEKAALHHGLEEPQAGINFGGRRKSTSS